MRVNTRIFVTAVLLLFLTWCGCQSQTIGLHVSPRVTGRVLDAKTRKPLSGVIVSRNRPDVSRSSPPKGGELLTRKPDIRTDANGSFALESETVLSLLPWGGWSSLRLSFEKGGYERLVTNISITELPTNNASTHRLVHLRDVLLHPEP
jgi:hypothetical protein